MDAAEQAVMCVLMLRGPQTPGELKQRTERMHPFAELAGVHDTLEQLIERGLVARLDRRPGHKEERYVQLLGEEQSPRRQRPSPPNLEPSPQPVSATSLLERVERLEREVAELRAAMRDPVLRAPAMTHLLPILASSSDTATGVGIPIAVAAGLVSFLSPCVLPLVPGYLSTVVGVTPADLKDGVGVRRVLVPSLLFIASFSAIFILLGMSATVIGSALQLAQTHARAGRRRA